MGSITTAIRDEFREEYDRPVAHAYRRNGRRLGLRNPDHGRALLAKQSNGAAVTPEHAEFLAGVREVLT